MKNKTWTHDFSLSLALQHMTCTNGPLVSSAINGLPSIVGFYRYSDSWNPAPIFIFDSFFFLPAMNSGKLHWQLKPRSKLVTGSEELQLSCFLNVDGGKIWFRWHEARLGLKGPSLKVGHPLNWSIPVKLEFCLNIDCQLELNTFPAFHCQLFWICQDHKT